jgi:hypothetical protein
MGEMPQTLPHLQLAIPLVGPNYKCPTADAHLPHGARINAPLSGGWTGCHYSSKDFFRQLPYELLARYFYSQGLLPELDVGAMPEGRPEALFEAIGAFGLVGGILTHCSPANPHHERRLFSVVGHSSAKAELKLSSITQSLDPATSSGTMVNGMRYISACRHSTTGLQENCSDGYETWAAQQVLCRAVAFPWNRVSGST